MSIFKKDEVVCYLVPYTGCILALGSSHVHSLSVCEDISWRSHTHSTAANVPLTWLFIK